MINTKTKGELGRRIEYDVEHDLFHPQNIYSDEYITPTFVEYVQKLEKENAELKVRVENQKSFLKVIKAKFVLGKLEVKEIEGYLESDQLTKAKEIIKQLMRAIPYGSGKLATESYDKAEQFLSEVEK